MTRYTGNHCPVCEQAFTDEDDIVVCPKAAGRAYPAPTWRRCFCCEGYIPLLQIFYAAAPLYNARQFAYNGTM